MIKVSLAVIVLIAASMVAGAYFQFNPAILIFAIPGFGIYTVARIGAPCLTTPLLLGADQATAPIFGSISARSPTAAAAATTP